MPTILRFAGLRVVIYTNDHRPAHVPVIGDGCEAVFKMNCGGGPIALRENYGFALARLRQIKIVLQEHRNRICSAWEKIHGPE
jgi:Domain of unknown function (DUF4160)